VNELSIWIAATNAFSALCDRFLSPFPDSRAHDVPPPSWPSHLLSWASWPVHSLWDRLGAACLLAGSHLLTVTSSPGPAFGHGQCRKSFIAFSTQTWNFH